MSREAQDMARKKRKRIRMIIVGVLGLLILGALYYGYLAFQESTKPIIKNSPGTTRALEIPNAKIQHFDEGTFAFDLPADWKLIKHDTAPYNLYSFHSTLTNADNRALDIYVDKVPQTMAINKALRVQAQGNNLTHGMLSENCTTFTPGSSTSTANGGSKPLSILSKWDGVEFLCDNDNIMRNVAGTSSAGNINKVTATGPTTGAHSFFFTYTDDNSTPDYTILYHMLDSFTVL